MEYGEYWDEGIDTENVSYEEWENELCNNEGIDG